MKQLGIYLTFPGNCEEALNFYKESLGGKIESLQRFGETPQKVSDDYKKKVIHAQFKAEGVEFMASDSMDGKPVTNGSNVSLSIDLNDEKEQGKVFEKLSVGGLVSMPLQETFWGARFGMVTDKFGINWMLNCAKPKK